MTDVQLNVTQRCKVTDMAKIPIMIRLEHDEAEALRTAAHRDTRSMSGLARILVIDGLTRIHTQGIARMTAPIPGQTTIDGEAPE